VEGGEHGLEPGGGRGREWGEVSLKGVDPGGSLAGGVCLVLRRALKTGGMAEIFVVYDVSILNIEWSFEANIEWQQP